MDEGSQPVNVTVNFPEFITGLYDLDILEQLTLLTNRLELFILLSIFNTIIFLYFVFRSVKNG